MLQLGVSGDVYSLGEASAAELVRRLEPTAPLEGGEAAPGSIQERIRGAVQAREPVRLDAGELALLGVVLEAWAVETEDDLPSDVEALRVAIAAHFP